jgi:3-deoxy-D-manno-octulosonic-acid transferase
LRYLYILLVYLIAPLVIVHDAWQSFTQPGFRGRARQRLGFVVRAAAPGSLWIHAVSVGEVQAAAAVVRALQSRYPELPIVMSTVTATGAQRAHDLFKGSVQVCYLPYDLPGSVSRFLDRIAPRAALILETEIWPTLYAAIHARKIPLVLGSARLSARSVRRYRRLNALVQSVLTPDMQIGAQTTADADRFVAVGAPAACVQVTGNVKYDLEIPPAVAALGKALREQWGAARPVWVAGSTHEGEEAAALQAHAAIRARHTDALLVLVPRHPQRFDKVRALLRERRVSFVQRSQGGLPSAGEGVLLVDTLGELQMFYAAADVAFVGGSLVPIGGHSLLEPAVLGVPIVSGPYTQNSQDVAALLMEHDALRLVARAEQLAAPIEAWFDDPAAARAAGANGARAVAANRGAVQRLVAMIDPVLKASGASPAISSAASGSR